LAPVLGKLEGSVATVRTLDFGADKTPPFLRGRGGRGIALMLEHEAALVAQFAAILRAGEGTSLRIMLPLVESAGQLAKALRPLLVGLGVDELSVSPARLDAIRNAVRSSGEAGDETRQLGYGLDGVVA